MQTETLYIGPGSDGDGRRRPKTNDFIRNDEHWLVRIGQEWAKHLGKPIGGGYNYRLDKLPDGFAGYQKSRGSNSKHVDRYVYGHHRGPARSVPDFLPHFIYLMDNGDARGCHCKLCVDGSRSKAPGGTGAKAASPAISSQYFARPQTPASRTQSYVPQPRLAGRPQYGMQQVSPDSDAPPPPRRKQVDEEGTHDTLRSLLDELKEAGPEGKIDEPFIESMSPDWRTGHAQQMQELKEMSRLPGHVPRKGELVMFVRNLELKEALGWDKAAQTWRVIDLDKRIWADRKGWSAGVVTQVPNANEEATKITDADLKGIPRNKQHNVVWAGFRIEPLPQPNSVDKSYTKQQKYVPLHAIRPLAMWKECMHGIDEKNWPPVVRHALTVASGFCMLGKYHFKGTWPEATVFIQGMFIGPELITIGDTVRLQNRGGGNAADTVTDIMVVTAIKVRLVNLDEASDDDYDSGHPYNTCTHISGHCYTQDPMRSYDGVGKLPIPPDSPLLPKGLSELGTWYHVTDPEKPRTRIEVPFQRVIGRSYESVALKAWFTPPTNISTPSTFQAVNAAAAKPIITLNDRPALSADLSRGLQGILEARAYSQQHDIRIPRDEGKTWFWADTRVEQLDVHEVNERFVGAAAMEKGHKDPVRSQKKLGEWRSALKVLDGKKGGLAEYYAARQQRAQEQARRESALGNSASGLVAGGAQAGPEGGTEVEESSEDGEEVGREMWGGDAMEVQQQMVTQQVLSDMDVDEDEDVDAGAALAAFKAAPAARMV